MNEPRKTLRQLAAEIPPLQTSLAFSPHVQRAVREWASHEEEAQRARIRVLAKHPRAFCGAAPCGRKAIYVPGPPSQRLSAICETEEHAWISAGYVVRDEDYRAAAKPLSAAQCAAVQALIRKVRER